MAALPGTPKTWVDGPPKVTHDDMNDELRDSLKYLKGQSGPTEKDDDLEMTGLGIGTLTPGARFHVYEDEVGFAAIVENIRTTSTPGGLLVASNKTGSHRVLTAGVGSIEEGITEKFGIDADGEFYYKSRTLWSHDPVTVPTAGDFNVPFTSTAVPGLTFDIAHGGWWFIDFSIKLRVLVSTDKVFSLLVNGPGLGSTPVDSFTMAGISFILFRGNARTILKDHHFHSGAPAFFTGAGTVTARAAHQPDAGTPAFRILDGSAMTAWFMGD